MSAGTLLANADDHLKAIALCLEGRLKMPALVLIHTGIDIMAALSRPALVKKTGKRQFIKWAEHRMACQERLGVSGLDLYAARCGIVHTATADSSLSDDGNARRIVYTWDRRPAPEPAPGSGKPGRTDAVVAIGDLADALSASIALFKREVEDDPAMAALVRRRSGTLFLVPATAS